MDPTKSIAMGKSVLKIKRSSAREIKRMLTDNPDFLIATRLNMVYQVAKGHSSREVAEWHGVSFKQVMNWVHRFEEYGLEGLENKSGRGRKSYLADEDLKELRNLILTKTPEQVGLDEKKWTGPVVLKAIKKQFNVKYKLTQVYKLIEKMGLAFKKGMGITEANNSVI